MKKLNIIAIIYLICTISVFSSCNKHINNDIELGTISGLLTTPPTTGSSTFLSSTTYQRVDSFIQTSYGTIDAINYFENTVTESGNSYLTYTYNVFGNTGQLVAQLIVVDLNLVISDSVLPHNDLFAMQLIDYSDINMTDTSGIIKLIDLNWDFHQYGTIDLTENNIGTKAHIELPSEIIGRYPGLKVSTHPCDSNKDSNISFSECYTCLTDAIDANGGGKWFCDSPFGAIPCWVSVTTSCIIIASLY